METKTALITGATSGIGAAFARRFAAQGYGLVLTGRREAQLRAVAQEIEAQYRVPVDVVLVELADPAGAPTVLEHAAGKTVEVLVNNAGFGVNSLFVEGDLASYRAMTAVHVDAPMQLVHALLPGMLARGRGAIINVSSDGAFLLMRKNSVYAASKGFLKTFSEALHLELLGSGVRVQALCPGLTHTDFHEKMGMAKARQQDSRFVHWMSPETVVDASLRALERDQVICIPGTMTRLEVALINRLPRRWFYHLMDQFARMAFGKKPAAATAAAVHHA